MRASRLCTALVTTTIVASAGCELVIPSNPFDPATDPARQAAVTISGTVTVADGRAPIGAEVVVDGADDVVIAVADDGSYTGEVRAGGIVVSARMLGFKSPVLPLSVSPGDSITVDLQLVADAPTSTVRGTVSAQPPLNVSGADVALVEVAPDGDDCAATVERVAANAGGDYVFGAVRPGRYRVFVASAGGVTALSDVVEVGDNDDLSVDALDIDPIGDGVRVEVSGNVVTATAEDIVDVVVDAQAGLEQLRIGLSPTFDPQQGSTGIIDYDIVTPLTLPAADGPATVFAQLLGRCGQSPVYEVPLVVDRSPPLILSASLNGIALSAGLEPTVVLRDAAASARLQLAGLDDSGPVRVVADGDISAALDVAAGAGQFAVAVDVDVPAAEGSYTVTFRIIDAAGNVTADAFGAVVVRDLEAPKSPIATAAAVETFGPRALVWLDPRSDCPPGAEPFSCETVLPQGPLFELRGGALTDFTPVAGPPFAVEVQPDVVTRFEIRAKDAAGNVSGSATVDVSRPTIRERFRLPNDRQFGMPVLGASAQEEARGVVRAVPRAVLDEPDTPTLNVNAGTAFFSVRPTPGIRHTTAYSALVAQPADLPSLGLKTSTSPFPQGLRRLTYDGTTQSAQRTYNRMAGGLGGAAGRLTWLETTVDGLGDGVFARQMAVGLNGDGRFDIAGADRLFPSLRLDDEGEPTVTRVTGLVPGLLAHRDLCVFAGGIACVRDDFRWRGLLDAAAPATSGVRGQNVAVAGLSHTRVAFHDDTRTPTIRSQVGDGVGFRFVGASFVTALGRGLPAVRVAEIDIELPAGTPIHTAVYTPSNNPPSLEHEDGAADIATEILTAPAQGGGRERIVMPNVSLFSRNGERQLIGILFPADVSFSIPVDDPAELPTELETFAAAPEGLINVVVPTLADAGRLPLDIVADGSAFPRIGLRITSTTTGGAPAVAGVVVSDFGANGIPDPLAVPVVEFPELAGALADERHMVVPIGAPGVQSAVTASADELLVPDADQSCVAVVRPQRDTPLESVSLEGQGLLDELLVRVFRSVDKTDTGIFVRDTTDFGSTLFFNPEVGTDCRSEVLTSRTDETTSLVVSPEVVTAFERSTVRVPALDEVTLEYAVLADIEDLLLTRPVTAGTQLQIRTTESDENFGDADLRVVFNDPQGTERFGEAIGDEDLLVEVPAGATEVQVFLLAFDFGNGDDALGTLSFASSGGVLQIGEFAIPPGTERVTVETFGDFFAFVGARARFNAAPTDDIFDCGDAESSACELLVPPGATSIFVAGELFAFESQVDDRVVAEVTMDANFESIEVARLDVGVGETARVSAASVADGPTLSVRFLNQAGEEIEDCSNSGAQLFCEERTLEEPLTMVIVLERGSVEATLDLRVEVFEPGCVQVSAERSQLDPGVLRAGEVYAIVVTDFDGWPASNPRIAVGRPVDDAAAADIRIVGTTLSPRFISSTQIGVPTVDQDDSRCLISLNLQSRILATIPTASQNLAAAVIVENGSSALAIADLSADTPALDVVYEVEPGDAIAALAIDANDVVRFVERVGIGQLRVSARGGDVANDDLCVALEEPLSVSSASFVDGSEAFVVGGVGPLGPVVRRYRLANDPCDPPTLELERVVAAVPTAVASADDDIFFISDVDAAGNGGSLTHISADSVELIAPAGQREVVGGARLSGATAIAFAPRLGSEGGLEMLADDGTLRSLSTGPASFQPTAVSTDDGVIIVSVDVAAVRGGRISIVAHDAEGNGSALVAAANVAAAPDFDPIVGRRFASDPILAADGSHLAVLGYAQNGDRTLDVLTMLGTSEVERTSFPETLPPGARGLEIVGDVVVVGYEGDPRAFLLADDEIEEIVVGDDERIIGAAGATILVGVFPGDVFQQKPPTTMSVVRRDPRGVDDDVDLGETLPATLFGRAFARVVDGGDEVLLLDALATPSVVWRMRPGQTATPSDGALRPLASSSSRLGRSALSLGVIVRETATGSALYR